MPWRASSVMEERLRFVARLLDGEGALGFSTTGAKPKIIGACSENHLCARQSILGTETMGIAL